MTGRGKLRLFRPSPDACVRIGISLGTSPPTLDASSDAPFHVIVTAKILQSPHPDRPITLWTHLSPLYGLHTRAFDNITCIGPESSTTKSIRLWPTSWPQYRHDCRDIAPGSFEGFVTVPPKGQGVLEVRHQVPASAIKAAGVQKGERYRVKFTDVCLGAKWWIFGALPADPDAVRLTCQRSPADKEDEEIELADPQWAAEFKERYGNRRPIEAEESDMLALVPEPWDVEFEVV